MEMIHETDMYIKYIFDCLEYNAISSLLSIINYKSIKATIDDRQWRLLNKKNKRYKLFMIITVILS